MVPIKIKITFGENNYQTFLWQLKFKSEKVQGRKVKLWKIYHQNPYILLSKNVSPIFLTQVNVFYRQLFLLNVTFPLNHPYFLKYSFLRKMHTRFCRGESVEYHCVKSVQMRSFSVPYSIRMPENTDQKKPPYLDTFHIE